MIKLSLPYSVVSKINAIFILDCINNNEIQIGIHCEDQIYDLLPNEQLNNERIVRIKCLDKTSFIEAIDRITNSCKKGFCPLIHIHGHGDKTQGFEVQSKEFIPWYDLVKKFMTITKRCEGETTIFLSACYSYQVVHEFLNTYEKQKGVICRLPFGFFYGYKEEVPAGIVDDEAKYIINSILQDGGKNIILNPPKEISLYSEYIYINKYLSYAISAMRKEELDPLTTQDISLKKIRTKYINRNRDDGFSFKSSRAC